jgi:hypothetical protein
MLWLVNLGFAAGGTVTPPTPSPAPAGPTPAGRSRRKRRYYVEIDGQAFFARSQAEALEILETARLLAERAAQSRADSLVEHAAPKAIRAGVVRKVAIKAPTVFVSDELRDAAIETQRAIEQLYRDASVAAELRLLLALQAAQEAEQDEEDVLLLLH